MLRKLLAFRLSVHSLVLYVLLLFNVAESLRIGAFNIRAFGKNKMKKDDVMKILLKIVGRYDLVFIQEIRNMNNDTVEAMMQKVKPTTREKFDYEMTKPLGTGSYKEQYAYLYRSDKITVKSSFVYDDVGNKFVREPFVLTFTSPFMDVKEVTVIGLHAMSTAVKKELDELAQVHQKITRENGNDNVIILGDLNADCNYCRKKCQQNLILRKDTKFQWLIADDVDTTVDDNTNCTYDQFIITGHQLSEIVIPESATIFEFDKKYNLTKDQAMKVSDHYPVEFILKEPNLEPVSTPSPTTQLNAVAKISSSPFALIFLLLIFFQ